MRKLKDVLNEKVGAGKVKPDLKGFGKSPIPSCVLITFNEMHKKKHPRNV
jgi:hypothetical protein